MAWRVRNQVSLARTEYGSVLLDEVRGAYWQLNSTGAVITDELLAGRQPMEICARLVEEYDVEDAQAAADVASLMDSLVQAGLLERLEQR